jgi:hypothetical protein
LIQFIVTFVFGNEEEDRAQVKINGDESFHLVPLMMMLKLHHDICDSFLLSVEMKKTGEEGCLLLYHAFVLIIKFSQNERLPRKF